MAFLVLSTDTTQTGTFVGNGDLTNSETVLVT